MDSGTRLITQHPVMSHARTWRMLEGNSSLSHGAVSNIQLRATCCATRVMKSKGRQAVGPDCVEHQTCDMGLMTVVYPVIPANAPQAAPLPGLRAALQVQGAQGTVHDAARLAVALRPAAAVRQRRRQGVHVGRLHAWGAGELLLSSKGVVTLNLVSCLKSPIPQTMGWSGQSRCIMWDVYMPGEQERYVPCKMCKGGVSSEGIGNR